MQSESKCERQRKLEFEIKLFYNLRKIEFFSFIFFIKQTKCYRLKNY